MSQLSLLADASPIVYLTSQDLTTLQASVVLVQDYQGAVGSTVKLDFTQIPANNYDAQKRLSELDATIAKAQAEKAQLQVKG